MITDYYYSSEKNQHEFNYDFEKTGMLVDFNTSLKLTPVSHCQIIDDCGFASLCQQNYKKMCKFNFFLQLLDLFSVN